MYSSSIDLVFSARWANIRSELDYYGPDLRKIL
jgi:hypothetical protein